jgi:hypothetical protein
MHKNNNKKTKAERVKRAVKGVRLAKRRALSPKPDLQKKS